MKSKPEMFKWPCVISAVCIASISLLVFVLIFSPLSPLGNTFKMVAIVLLPQLVFIGSALSSGMPPLLRVLLALALAFNPSLVHARILTAVWKRNLFMNNKNRAVIAGVMIFLVFPALAAVYYMPAANPPKRPDRTMPKQACMNNVRILVQMCHMYSIDYDGFFPPDFEALDRSGYSTKNFINCPASSGAAGYGMNTAAAPGSSPVTPLLGDFDSRNHSGEGGSIGYVDGSTRWYDGEYSAGSGPLENVLAGDWVRQ